MHVDGLVYTAVTDGDDDYTNITEETAEGTAVVRYPARLSGIRDAGDENGDTTRPGGVVYPDPNTNLLHPRTVVPVLHGDHDPGKHWLTCTVLGVPGANHGRWNGANPPTVAIEEGTFRVVAPIPVRRYSRQILSRANSRTILPRVAPTDS